MSNMTGAKLLVDQLVLHGSQKIFGVPGESYLSVLDALVDVDALDFITCRQEGGAAMMAEAHGKLTGKPGICIVTRGPGATNASAGVYVAFQDSTPMILFIGQVARPMQDREAFQEIDYRRMFGQMAKWVAQIDEADRIPEYIARAYQTATSGRPGPVVLALPEDILSGRAQKTVSLKSFEPARSAPPKEHMARFSKMLFEAEKPLMIVGGGGWSKTVQGGLKAYCEQANLPVAASFRCQDYIDNRSSCYVGHVGIGIDVNLAKAVEESDLLIVLGARLGEMTTSGYDLLKPPKTQQKLVHIYPQGEEIGRVYQADLGIVSTSHDFVLALEEKPQRRWAKWCETLRKSYLEFSKPPLKEGDDPLCEMVKYMRARLDDEAVLTNGAGNYSIWGHRFFTYYQYGTQLAPTSGSMGYGLPAALAAKLESPERQVVCMAGDGCFMMTCQEFATAVQHGANVIVLVVNNSMFGTIRMHQEKRFPYRISGTNLQNPDFSVLATAFGGLGQRVETITEFETAFERALEYSGPSLIENIVDNQVITPAMRIDDLQG
ncbi:Thiamine pyrophosphate protein [Candidatus Terasakiella magnetica]|uniref:Thiamine pyrophosphate protein n=1 Tax=Candidatus Terasakiella magnetica TaxID=1867952 RepID=A0A1C3RLK1_9PROT|nr:thiamine pyrophosphate-binding protein [Candidatus Terasakiella magnetica]SCA58155.1 Thiamine pyrophosphate protein [Candidatus Terasakiella magnetica]